MPRRIGEFRLLAEKVRLWLNDRDGEGRDRWPKYKELFRYLRQTCDWSGSEREYKVLRNRGYGPAMLVEGLFGYLTAYSRATLDNFLKSVGRTDGMAISARELRDEYSSVCDHAQIRTDWRSQGWRGLADMFSAALFGIDDRSLCRSAAEVCEIARWIMADVGRSVAGEEFDHTGSAEAYVEVAVKHMQRSLSAYESMAMGWWDVAPWSVAKAMCGEDQVGGSIVLPLRPTVYRDLLRGKLSDSEIEPDMLETPSRHILGEGITTSLPGSGRTRLGWATARQMTTIIYQVARLTLFPLSMEPTNDPLRLLCVGGTTDFAHRLERHGYRRMGWLKSHNVPLYELEIPPPEQRSWFPTSAARAYSGVIGACQAHIRRAEMDD